VTTRAGLSTLFLLPVIVAERERHQAIERHFLFSVERNQLRADTRQFEPLPHHGNRHAEPGGDILVAHLLIGQRLILAAREGSALSS
jgi:hypothetical protein